MRISVLAAGTLALSLAASAIACSDDSNASSDGDGTGNGSTDGGTSSPGTTVLPDGAVVSTEPPVYAVASYVTSPSATTYVIVSDTLTGELKTESAAIEVDGAAVMGGPPSGKRLYIGTAASGEVKRYDLGADATSLTESGSVNFEAQQVPSLSGYGSGFQFVDTHKAYWLSWSAGKVVVWDPEDMVVSKAIDVPQIIRNNPDTPGTPYTTSVTGAPIRDGKMLYYFTAWDSRNAGVIKVVNASTVVAIDTTTDTAQVIVDEGGCGYARDGIVVGDWIYLVSEAVGGSVNYLNSANGPAPCMRRFNKTTQQFDAGYKVDLNSLAGGSPVGSLVTSPSGQAFVYVLDRTTADPLVANGTISNPRILSVTALWKTARLTVGDAPKIELLDNPLASSSVLPHSLTSMKVTATFDPTSQDIREVGDNGVLASDRANAKLNGNTGSIVQLR